MFERCHAQQYEQDLFDDFCNQKVQFGAGGSVRNTCSRSTILTALAEELLFCDEQNISGSVAFVGMVDNNSENTKSKEASTKSIPLSPNTTLYNYQQMGSDKATVPNRYEFKLSKDAFRHNPNESFLFFKGCDPDHQGFHYPKKITLSYEELVQVSKIIQGRLDETVRFFNMKNLQHI